MGKIALTSDWHLKPGFYPHRTVPAMVMQEDVINQIAELVGSDGNVVVAGDLFHRWHVPVWYLNWLAALIHTKFNIFAIYGNHDLPSGNIVESEKTALHALSLMGAVSIPKGGEQVNINGYWFEFCHFGSEPSFESGDFLILHRPVFPSEVPFWASDGLTAPELLDKYPGFKVIVTGDIHVPFICRDDGEIVDGFNVNDGRRYVINPGGIFPETEHEGKDIYILDDSGDVTVWPLVDNYDFSHLGVQFSGNSNTTIMTAEVVKNIGSGRLDFWGQLLERHGKDTYDFVRELMEKHEVNDGR